MKAVFVFEKETKNTVRFQEVVEEGKTPIIGPVYIQKSALKELGHTGTQGIELDVELVKENK